MKYIDLIGISLKSDILSDLFETYDVPVVYEYDRTHENLPDEYRAEVPDLGLQFVFDEHQSLQTSFMELVEITTFNPFDEDDRLNRFDSKKEATRFAKSNGIQTTEGKGKFMGEKRDWIRFEYDTYSIHYEYVDKNLKMITLQKKDV